MFPSMIINEVFYLTGCLHFYLLSLFPTYVWLSYFLRLLLTVILSQTLVDSLRRVVVRGALCWSPCIPWEAALEV